MCGYIYKTTCIPSGMIYVGQKKSNKFLNDRYLGSGLLLRRALTKYGHDSFTVELLEECSSKEELDSREVYWIAELRATDRQIGYNITAGGAGTKDAYKNYPQDLLAHRKENRKPQEPRRQIHRGSLIKQVPISQMQNYLDEGWLEGTSDAVRAHARENRLAYLADHPDAGKASRFKPGQQPWNKGISPSRATRQKLRDANLGKKLDPDICARKSASMKRRYQEGLKPPRLGIAPSNKGERGRWIWMWRPGENIHILAEEVSVYEAQGYQRGRKGLPRSAPWNKGLSRKDQGLGPVPDRVWVHKDADHKLVILSEVDTYLAQGYLRGYGKRST